MADLHEAFDDFYDDDKINGRTPEQHKFYLFERTFPNINRNCMREQRSDISTDDNSEHYYNINDKKVYSYNYYAHEWHIPDDSSQKHLIKLFDTSTFAPRNYCTSLSSLQHDLKKKARNERTDVSEKNRELLEKFDKAFPNNNSNDLIPNISSIIVHDGLTHFYHIKENKVYTFSIFTEKWSNNHENDCMKFKKN